MEEFTMVLNMVRGWNSGLHQSKITRKYGRTRSNTCDTQAYDNSYWLKIISHQKPIRTERQENPRKRNVLTVGLEYDWLLRFYYNMNA